MARRMRRRRAPNPMVTLVQVVLLIGLLLMIVFFRDRIGTGAGALLDSLSTSDIEIAEQPSSEEDPGEEAPSSKPSPP